MNTTNRMDWYNAGISGKNAWIIFWHLERHRFYFDLETVLIFFSCKDVEFNCFTDGFPGATIKYRIWIFPGESLIGISETTANIYVKLVGEKDETPRIPIHNKTTLEVEFECNNLGRLVVLAIGN